MNTDFDMEFMSDDEIELLFDEFVDSIKDDILDDESKTTILNPMRLQQLQFSYAVLKYITKDTNAELSYKLYDPCKHEFLNLINQNGLRVWQSLQIIQKYIH